MHKRLIPLALLAFATPAVLARSAGAQIAQEYRQERGDVIRLADRLEDATQRLHLTARDEQHHHDRAEQRALWSLRQLADAARDYNQAVQRTGGSLRRTFDDLNALVSRYNVAVERYEGLHPFPSVAREFATVGARIEDLVALYRFDGRREGFRDLRRPRWQDRDDDDRRSREWRDRDDDGHDHDRNNDHDRY